jgi:hypothetical protein
VGGSITLFSTCDLNAASEVRICGIAAAFEGGQVVAAQTFLCKPGAQVWQLFATTTPRSTT